MQFKLFDDIYQMNQYFLLPRNQTYMSIEKRFQRIHYKKNLNSPSSQNQRNGGNLLPNSRDARTHLKMIGSGVGAGLAKKSHFLKRKKKQF